MNERQTKSAPKLPNQQPPRPKPESSPQLGVSDADIVRELADISR